MKNLLLEIGTEEIPASYIEPALKQMGDYLMGSLRNNRLSCEKIETAATPRRLTIFASDVSEAQESAIEEISGPPAKIAFDDEGKPTKAAIGFAKSQGVPLEDIQIKDTDKGKYCVVVKTLEGESTLTLLPNILLSMVRSVSWPKSMRWKGKDFSFARPVRSLLALFGSDVVEIEINGIKSGRITKGHPFLAADDIEICCADYVRYKEKLRENKVIVDISERRSLIKKRIEEILSKYGGELREIDLLNEVTNLVEYPSVVEGNFNSEFLKVPAAVIEAAMMEHQRYFPVRNGNGKLQPKFIVITNRLNDYDSLVSLGNERVLKARLDDAVFFWNEDKKTPLEKRVNDLKQVMFHEKLGTYYERTQRLVQITRYLCDIFLREAERDIKAAAERAALLCKTDLVTSMVGEFPSLQGIMGREYALQDGESTQTAAAIAEHYMPRHAGDHLPETMAGTIVSIADKLDAIVGCFTIGLIPTGSQDPYSLRRQTHGIIRMVESRGLRFSLRDAIEKAQSFLPVIPESASKSQLMEGVLGFFKDRLYQVCLDRNYRYDIINAALASGFDDIVDFINRLKTLAELSDLDFWQDLVTLVERTYNIGKKAKVDGEVDAKLLREIEEKTLWDVYNKNKDEIVQLVDAENYTEASLRYCEIFAEVVHTFFDKVFVNVDDEKIRNNRLIMLKRINELYSAKIADLSQIVPPEDSVDE